jgi:hypothetical protein
MRLGELGSFIPFAAKEIAGKASAGPKAATPHVDQALAWGTRQHARFQPHLPAANEIEKWARKRRQIWMEQKACLFVP